MATAYLWIAEEAKIHPANPELLGVISLVWVGAALATVVVPLFVLMSKSRPKDQPPTEEGDHG